jgi:dihydroorotate dehydrogenase electron transfer subunit
MGAADESGLLPASELPSSVEYVVATDDGSRGHHGFVTDLVPDYLRWADQVFACGPEAMFRSLRAVVLPQRIGGKPPVQVSVERTMACGLGACLGCVVETKRGMQASCVQGPVFDMDDVVW